jgi:predicted TPR repeat methyltransferase
LTAFERSVALQADFDLAWERLSTLQATGRGSAEALTAATTANPQCTLAWMRQAETLEQLGRLEAACAAYGQVVQHTPPTEPLHEQAQRHLQRLRL